MCEYYSKNVQPLIGEGKKLLLKFRSILSGKQTINPVEAKTAISQPKELFEKFVLTSKPEILFDNAPNSIKEAFLKINNVDGIRQILTKNQNDDSKILLKNLDAYLKSVEKMRTDLIVGKIDEDSRSEKFTGKFLSLLESYFVNKFIDGIYRGFQNKKDLTSFYEVLLSGVNNYLQSLYIFTKNADLFKAGCHYSDDLLSRVEPTVKETPEKSKHGTIFTTERLPYFIQYREEASKEVEEWYIKGKILVYKFKE